MKKINELLEKTGLSSKEVQLIKKVAIISAICCISIVAGVWLYFKLSLKTTEKIITVEEFDSKKLTPIPLDIQAHTLIAQSLFNRGTPAEAIPYLRRALNLNPKDLLIQYNLAVALLEAGFFKEGYSNFEQLADAEIADSLRAPICIKTGIALFYMGDVEQSTKKLEECLSQYPKSAEALCFMGQIQTFQSGDTSTIRSLFEETVRLDSSSVEGWYQLGRFEMAQGDTFKARRDFLHALELNPLHIKSHARLGMLYFYMDNIDLAISSYRTALALNPADYNTRYNLGELFYTIGDTIAALREFTQTLTDNPAHTEANFKVGLISMSNNMFKEAVRYFETALAQDPSSIRILLQLAVSFERLDMMQQAISTYKKILSIDELNPVAQQKVKLLAERNDNIFKP